MKYAIEFTREAESGFASLLHADRRLAGRILRKIESLADAPREGKPLVGNHQGEFSLRVGSYRIIYEVDFARRIIFILTVAHRKNAY
jgi:mRNA interferase RelE/StbE